MGTPVTILLIILPPPNYFIIAYKLFIYLEQGQGDIPTFYTYEEGLSHLTAEGQATLERLEGMLSQSVSSQYNMAGVRTEDSIRDYEGEYPFSSL